MPRFASVMLAVVVALAAGCGDSNKKTELPTTSLPKPVASDASSGAGTAPAVKAGVSKD